MHIDRLSSLRDTLINRSWPDGFRFNMASLSYVSSSNIPLYGWNNKGEFTPGGRIRGCIIALVNRQKTGEFKTINDLSYGIKLGEEYLGLDWRTADRLFVPSTPVGVFCPLTKIDPARAGAAVDRVMNHPGISPESIWDGLIPE